MDVPILPKTTPLHLSETAKAIRDLELLVRGLLASFPSAKPWQRQVRTHFTEADRLLQILRLTIAMDREASEVSQAAVDLMTCLRAANMYIGAGRADMGTKNAVQLGFSLGRKISAGVSSNEAQVAQANPVGLFWARTTLTLLSQDSRLTRQSGSREAWSRGVGQQQLE